MNNFLLRSSCAKGRSTQSWTGPALSISARLTLLSAKCIAATAIKSMQLTRKRGREIRTSRQISSPSIAALWRTSIIGIEDRDGQAGAYGLSQMTFSVYSTRPANPR